MLTKTKIIRLFEVLNKKLKEKGIKGEVGIVGGTVMCLVYNARSATKDIDAIFIPTTQIRVLVEEISHEEGVPADWLNDGAKGYIQGDFNRFDVLSLSNLSVWAPEPSYMLAMKCISARIDTNDKDDVQFLIKYLRIESAQKVFDIISKFYPKNQIPAKAQFFIEELFE